MKLGALDLGEEAKELVERLQAVNSSVKKGVKSSRAEVFSGFKFIENSTLKLGQQFDKIQGSNQFAKLVELSIFHSRGEYVEREDRPCKQCYEGIPREELPENFHTTLSCPVKGYNRVYKVKKHFGIIPLWYDQETRDSFYYMPII